MGLKGGQKWCLCAARWKEAFDYAKTESPSSSEPIVPKVHLHATHERALDVIDMKDLKENAAETEAGNASNVAQSRSGNAFPGGVNTKERTELAGKKEMTSREL